MKFSVHIGLKFRIFALFRKYQNGKSRQPCFSHNAPPVLHRHGSGPIPHSAELGLNGAKGLLLTA